MVEIMMAKPKKVGDSAMVTDLGDGMLVLGKPTVVSNPATGSLENIESIITTDKETYCPQCHGKNEHGIEITVTEKGMLIYACKKCNQFVWCRVKEKP